MEPSDGRPPVWIGHMIMKTDRVAESNAFMVSLGLRPIVQEGGFAVLELRGGTHLVLLGSEDALDEKVPFDLMVDDIDATHDRLRELGHAPSEIADGKIHRSFSVRDPSGQEITFNSSHVSDRPV